MRPEYLIRLIGGPVPGEHAYSDEDGFVWPPPEAIKVPGNDAGRYRRVTYSQIDAQTAGDYVIRGAEYEWVGE